MRNELAIGWLEGAASIVFAALLSALLIVLLRPLLRRHALAKPNARSSHITPTPQGGGIAVIGATIATAYAIWHFFAAGSSSGEPPLTVFAAAVLIAALGVADDIRSIEVVPRLLVQAVAVAIVIYVLPEDLRILPFLPLWVERILLGLAGLWFVNLVNFMDGLDWMMVAEIVPITATLALLGLLGTLPPQGTAIALALCGAMIGFAYFNRPVAKLFLGDVGSLPIGLVVGWLLLLLAARGHLIAAILLALYYLADATITLFRRIFRGDALWQAHRSHFYQLATDRGYTVLGVVGRVFAVNVLLAVLAVLAVNFPKFGIAGLAVGTILVGALLFAFAQGKKEPR
jgi:UDP-N-acetylmuramyl pentapeptide phosphotransferase/UDP-N-acetylglucosamine-1-phosphate transferase